jgi:EmrB/QacA subfamily drug resistance transporter
MVDSEDRGRRMRKEVILALAALGFSNALLAQDLAALNVALPSIERDLDIDLTTAQWVVNAYLLVYGMLIVTGGRLADEIGRRRIFLLGGAIFAVMSLVAGLAPNAAWLIGARALMGIGSGLMLPAISGMGYAVLPAQRAEMAGGLLVGAYGVGMAAGPLLGGALTEYLGWRWIQFIAVPLVALAMLGVWRAIPAPAAAGSRPRVDVLGIATISVGLVALLFALDQATDWGWGDWRIRLSLIVAIAFIAAFVLVERRAGATALIPGDVVRDRGVALACALKVLMAPAYAAALLYLPQLMQKTLDFSPLQAGIGMLPMLGGYAIVSFLLGSFSGRRAVRPSIIVGLAGLALGPWLLSRFDAAAGYASLVVGMAVFGVGLGLFQPSIVTEAVEADQQGRKSLVSGLALMFQFVGGAIGLGLTTTIVASSERAAIDGHLAGVAVELPDVQREALNRMLAGTESARQVLQQFDPAVARDLFAAAAEAFADGVRAGLRVDAGIAALGFVLALLLLRGARQRAAQPGHP